MVATIGYERASLEDFIATLELCQIDLVVDIRDRAQSRRKGFSKGALSEALSDAGIAYLHLKELGDPKEGREAARRGDFTRFREVFTGVMRTDAAKKALKELENLASFHEICLMCFERDQSTCHRKIVADHLSHVLQVKTRHLGVSEGAGSRTQGRRMRHTDKGSTASLQPIL